jgi:hypothetical protein
MMNLGKKLGFAALLAFGTAGAVNASTIVLDTFDYTPVVNLQVNQGTTQDSTTRFDVNSFLGDVEYTLDYINGPASLDSASVSFDYFGDGVMSYSNDDFMVSSLTMLYSAFDGTPASALDLTQGGSFSAFYFDILSSDLGFTIDVTVGSAAGANTSNYMSASSSVSTYQRELIDFSNFSTVAGTGADFTAVDFVNIILTTTSVGSDLTITEFGIASVPEPTTLAIFGLALVGFAFNSKRKAQ